MKPETSEAPEATHSREDLARVAAAARAVVEHSGLREAAQAVLSALLPAIGAGIGRVAVREEPDDALTWVAAAGEMDGIPESGSPVALPPSLARMSARASGDRAVFANDLRESSNGDAPAPLRPAWHNALLAPLAIAGESAGFLVVADKPGGFSPADGTLAELFAELVAVVLARSRTVQGCQRAEERSTRFAAELREATVALTRSLDRDTILTTLLDRLRSMIPFDRGRVLLFDEESGAVVRALLDDDQVISLPPEKRMRLDPAEHPLVHEIRTSGKSIRIADVGRSELWTLSSGPELEASWLAVPLFARGEVAGFFALSVREPDVYTDEHVRLAEAMSSQASVAVENAVLFEQMQESKSQAQSLARRLVDAQEGERRNISRELHDEAGQSLASLRFGLRVLEREIGEGGDVTGRVAELMLRVDSVIDGLHRLAVDLRPASLDHLGLDAALRQFSRSTATKFGLAVRFKARGFGSERLPPKVETALYRIVQEAVTNVVRHARATRVDVLAEHRGDRVMVMVEDDGVGFDPEESLRGEHLGLMGLRERAEELGGTFHVESSAGAGSTVVVEVPSADPHPDR